MPLNERTVYNIFSYQKGIRFHEKLILFLFKDSRSSREAAAQPWVPAASAIASAIETTKKQSSRTVKDLYRETVQQKQPARTVGEIFREKQRAMQKEKEEQEKKEKAEKRIREEEARQRLLEEEAKKKEERRKKANELLNKTKRRFTEAPLPIPTLGSKPVERGIVPGRINR